MKLKKQQHIVLYITKCTVFCLSSPLLYMPSLLWPALPFYALEGYSTTLSAFIWSCYVSHFHHESRDGLNVPQTGISYWSFWTVNWNKFSFILNPNETYIKFPIEKFHALFFPKSPNPKFIRETFHSISVDVCIIATNTGDYHKILKNCISNIFETKSLISHWQHWCFSDTLCQTFENYLQLSLYLSTMSDLKAVYEQGNLLPIPLCRKQLTETNGFS